ncbi:MAG: hypothetical protein ACI9JP_004041, partial [Granulosicoccus sp.]
GSASGAYWIEGRSRSRFAFDGLSEYPGIDVKSPSCQVVQFERLAACWKLSKAITRQKIQDNTSVAKRHGGIFSLGNSRYWYGVLRNGFQRLLTVCQSVVPGLAQVTA